MSSNTTFGSKLCHNCGVRPQYCDPTTGNLHRFCSRGCANASASSTPPISGNCDYCHARPKYFDGTQTHPFCRRSCAQAAKLAGFSSPTVGVASTIPAHSGTCLAPGCSKPVYRDASGKSSKYCSKTHKLAAETSCIACRKVPHQGRSHYCHTCRATVVAKAPMILEIPEEHEVYKSVASQFQNSWRSNSACPAVRAIYKIVSSQSSLNQYETYRATVETRGNFLLAQRSAGNENRRWHGTRRQCNLGDQGFTTFCSSPTCALCSIIRTSYNLSSFAKRGSFGTGIYTSSTSSKSNGYSQNTVQSPWKAMLLNKVVVGKGYKLSSCDSSLTAPPAGYDSVLGEVGVDELIVYTNDAVRPSYLLMYDG